MGSIVEIVKISKTRSLPSRILLSSMRRPVSGLASINVLSDKRKDIYSIPGTLIRGLASN
jgi:hypothetical protein